MKSLLAAIKLELQNAATLSFVRDSDIFITEHENFLLPSIRFPAIAIKDGPIVYKVATKSQENDTLLVKIIMYVQLQKPEAGIMGDAATSAKGVLEVAALVRDLLKSNRLSGLVDSAWPESETESEILALDEVEAVQMKIITMRYERY